MSMYDDANDSPSRRDSGGEPAEKKGMGTGTKVLLILLAVFGGTCLICCGVGVYFWSKTTFEFKDDPAAAQVATAEMANIEVPEQFSPKGVVVMDVVFFKMKMAIYQAAGDEGMLMLAQVNIPGADQAAQEAQIRQAMQQNNQGAKNLNVTSSETREFEIGGEKVGFLFTEGTEQQNQTEFKQVVGTFQGKEGLVFLMLQVKKDSYDDEAVVKMFESMKDQSK